MSDDRVYIGMFRPLIEEVPGFPNRIAVHHTYWSELCHSQEKRFLERYNAGAWDRPVYATRDEIIEKMAKLELEKRDV